MIPVVSANTQGYSQTTGIPVEWWCTGDVYSWDLMRIYPIQIMWIIRKTFRHRFGIPSVAWTTMNRCFDARKILSPYGQMIIQEYGQGTKCGDHQKMYQNVLLPTQQRALVRIDRGPANVRGRQNDVETFFWDEKKWCFPELLKIFPTFLGFSEFFLEICFMSCRCMRMSVP